MKTFEESEKKEQLSAKIKKQATEAAKEGKKPIFLNKCKQTLTNIKYLLN